MHQPVDVSRKGSMWLRFCNLAQGFYHFNPTVDFVRDKTFNVLCAALWSTEIGSTLRGDVHIHVLEKCLGSGEVFSFCEEPCFGGIDKVAKSGADNI